LEVFLRVEILAMKVATKAIENAIERVLDSEKAMRKEVQDVKTSFIWASSIFKFTFKADSFHSMRSD
jgi:hypothetical protein